MKKITLIALITSLQFVQAQSNFDKPQNTMGINIAGDGGIVAFNYERIFVHSEYFFVASKVGIGINQEIRLFGGDAPSYATIPLSITANVGKYKSYAEFGFGFTTLANDKQVFYFGYPILGYRYYPLLSRQFFIRVFAQIPVIAQNLLIDTHLDTSFPTFHDRVLFSPVGVHLGIAF